MLRLASRIIVVGSIILVLVLVVGGCVLEDLQWQQMMHPNWPKQETAGAEVDRAVGAAVDRYEAVLDAQWGDADCVVERCPKSSKSLPGMPRDRAEFTKEERFNLERKAHYLSREPVSSTDLYSVVKTDAGVEAIVYVTVAKCDGSEVSVATDPHRMMLAPSTSRVGEYVVMEDAILTMKESPKYPEAFSPLYSGRKGEEPDCS